MAQELDTEVSRPYLRILNEKGLYFPRVPCFICSEVLPLFHFNGVSITDADTKGSNHAGEKFVVRQDECVDPDIFL
jgi:hypothetical protein